MYREGCCVYGIQTIRRTLYTPWTINMEHNNGGLEDDFPFQFGDF